MCRFFYLCNVNARPLPNLQTITRENELFFKRNSVPVIFLSSQTKLNQRGYIEADEELTLKTFLLYPCSKKRFVTRLLLHHSDSSSWKTWRRRFRQPSFVYYLSLLWLVAQANRNREVSIDSIVRVLEEIYEERSGRVSYRKGEDWRN